jgi:hypothetical protein
VEHTKEPVFDGTRCIGFLHQGAEGDWWLTLSGSVETTLGPEDSRDDLCVRGVETYRSFNDLPCLPEADDEMG